MNTSVPNSVGVYGGGRMGAGIAHAFLIKGSAVTIIERDEEAVDAARHRVSESLNQAARRGTIVEFPAEILHRLKVSVDPRDLSSTDLVIEAVPESLDLKTAVLRAIESAAPTSALATNTSSLSIDVLACGLEDPTKLVGLHFFNPVPVSELVEIVTGAQTDPQVLRQAEAWVGGLGKTGVVIRDAPGFATTRLAGVSGLVRSWLGDAARIR